MSCPGSGIGSFFAQVLLTRAIIRYSSTLAFHASSCRANFYILCSVASHTALPLVPGKYAPSTVSQCVGGQILRFTLAHAQLNLATSVADHKT